MKLVVDVHTNDEAGVLSPGDEIDLPEALALEWIKKEWAHPVKAKIEKSEGPAGKKETAALK